MSRFVITGVDPNLVPNRAFTTTLLGAMSGEGDMKPNHLLTMLPFMVETELDPVLQQMAYFMASSGSFTGIYINRGHKGLDEYHFGDCDLVDRVFPCGDIDEDNVVVMKYELDEGNMAGWANFAEFVAARRMSNEWVIHHTGGGCMVATTELMLKDMRIVSLGVNAECVVLYNHSWLHADERDDEDEGVFTWHESGRHEELLDLFMQHLAAEAMFCVRLRNEVFAIMKSKLV